MDTTGLFRMNLRCAPFTNRLGEIWDTDSEMDDYFANSHFYMIGQRPKIDFKNYSMEGWGIKFDIESCGSCISDVVLPLDQYSTGNKLEIALVDKTQSFVIHEVNGDAKKLLQWFTPDRLIHFWQRGKVQVEGLEKYRKFWNFRIHYVGISKKNDSFTRLFRGAHKKRAKILGLEDSFDESAHISDELCALIFDFEELRISRLSNESESDATELAKALRGELIATPEVSAEAERAFVRLLRSKYNEVEFLNYPNVLTAEFQKLQFNRHLFFIDENIDIFASEVIFRGTHTPGLEYAINPSPDAIMVGDGNVKIIEGTSFQK